MPFPQSSLINASPGSWSQQQAPEGYVHTVNLELQCCLELGQGEVVGDVFLDTHLDLLNPPESYVAALLDHAEDPSGIWATVTGFRKLSGGPHGKYTLVPIVRRPEGSYGRNLNPYLHYRSVLASASRTMGRLKALGDQGIPIIHLVFTFPKWWSISQLNDTGVEAAWEVWADFRQELERFFERNRDAELAYTVNLHVWSSRNPLDPHFHFHVVLIGARFMEEGPKRINPMLDVDTLRGRWAASLYRCGALKPAETPDIWSGYITLTPERYPEVLHLLKYARRGWLYDFALFCRDYPNARPDRFHADRIAFFVEYRNQTRTYCGWRALHELGAEERCVNPITGEKSEVLESEVLALDLGALFAVYRGKRSRCELVGYTTGWALLDFLNRAKIGPTYRPYVAPGVFWGVPRQEVEATDQGEPESLVEPERLPAGAAPGSSQAI